MTAEAIEELGERAFLKYSQREEVLKSLSYVKDVIPQRQSSYRENLNKIKPDYVVHGDDWASDHQKEIRKKLSNY